ncbi:MAG: fluoride efflux transporter CrcB [Chitinophagaceae bacterium]
MNNVLLVGLGGALGSIIRYTLQRFNTGSVFPYGTLLVNLSGCLLIGILWGFWNRNNLNDESRTLLMTGFCGGFTTFSAFTLEAVQLIHQNKWLLLVGYISLSVIGGILMTFAGYKLTS